jgi:hypothetical protein
VIHSFSAVAIAFSLRPVSLNARTSTCVCMMWMQICALLGNPGEEDIRDLAWVCKRILAPLGLMLALTFETQAVQRIPKDMGPTSKPEEGSAEEIWKRIADHSFEQTLVTLLTALSLAHVEGKIAGTCPHALAVACVYMYLIGRPIFALGYLTEDQMNRLPGLFIGGFWLNLGYMAFCVLQLVGVGNTPTVWYSCVAAAPLLIFAAVFVALPTKKATDGEDGEEKPLQGTDADQSATVP